jgi:hypothetical protein
VSFETDSALSKSSFQWITFSSKRFDDYKKNFSDAKITRGPHRLWENPHRGERVVEVKVKALYISVLKAWSGFRTISNITGARAVHARPERLDSIEP